MLHFQKRNQLHIYPIIFIWIYNNLDGYTFRSVVHSEYSLFLSPILQVVPLKKVCNGHHRHTSTVERQNVKKKILGLEVFGTLYDISCGLNGILHYLCFLLP